MNVDARPVALVTGGSAGLGFVLAKTLLASGYRVLITGRDAARLQAAAAQLSVDDSGHLLTHACDVSSASEVKQLIAAVEQQWHRLDVLVNCVGTSDRGLIENLQVEDLETLWRQNVVTE